MVHLGPELASQVRSLWLTEESEVVFEAVSYRCVEPFDVDDVAVSADRLEQRRLLAADEPLVLGLCLVEQTAADIGIKVCSHFIGVKSGLKSWPFQKLLAELLRFVPPVRHAVNKLLDGLYQQTINGQHDEPRIVVLKALVGEVEEPSVEPVSHDRHSLGPMGRIRPVQRRPIAGGVLGGYA